ncbi:MAG TPA: hypothetical protein VGB85_14125 [Nannocystis sp.]
MRPVDQSAGLETSSDPDPRHTAPGFVYDLRVCLKKYARAGCIFNYALRERPQIAGGR